MTNVKQQHPDERFEELRSLLLSEDQHKLADLEILLRQLQEELSHKDKLLARFDPIVGELLRRRMENSRQEMADMLAPIISLSIKKQVAEAREDVVDALYPVVGSMIRRLVAEYMKKLRDDINASLNRTVSPKIWSKWLKARVLRVNPAEVIMADSMALNLEEVYLISRDAGLLIAYVNPTNSRMETQDAMIIGGMLTAIKSFAEDAFSQDKEGELREINYSDRTIHIDSGRYTFLAAVYSGLAPGDFGKALQGCHNRIHSRFHRELREYNGNNSSLSGIDAIVRDFARESQEAPSG